MKVFLAWTVVLLVCTLLVWAFVVPESGAPDAGGASRGEGGVGSGGAATTPQIESDAGSAAAPSESGPAPRDPVAVEPAPCRLQVLDDRHRVELRGVDLEVRFDGGPPRSFRSGPQGIVQLLGAPAWTTAEVAVAMPYELVSPSVVEHASGELVQLLVRSPFGLFLGTVRDERGEKLNGVRLGIVGGAGEARRLRDRSGPGGRVVFQLPDAVESFRLEVLEDVERSAYRLTDPETVYRAGEVGVPIRVEHWPMESVAFRLRAAGGILAARFVTDPSDSHKAIPAGGLLLQGCEVDDQGLVHVPLRQGERGRIQFFVDLQGGGTGATRIVAYASPQPETTLDVAPDRRCRFVVKADAGRPVTGAAVRVVMSGQEVPIPPQMGLAPVHRTAAVAVGERVPIPVVLDEGVTDAAGEVDLNCGAASAARWVHVAVGGFTAKLERVPEGVPTHEILLARSGAVEGSLSAATRAAARARFGIDGDLEVVLRNATGGLLPATGTVVGDEGRFAFDTGDAVGDWELHLHGISGELPLKRVLGEALASVRLAAGVSIDLGVVDAAVAAPGRVVGRAQVPAVEGGWRVEFARDGAARSARLGPSGAFAVDLAAGVWRVRLLADGYALVFEDVSIRPGAEIPLALEPNLEHLTVAFEELDGLQDGDTLYLVDAASDGSQWLRLVVGPQREAELWLPPGDYLARRGASDGPQVGVVGRLPVGPLAVIR